MKIDLSKHRGGNFSQFGEDFVVEKLFNLLGINNGHLVEFGAFDGLHFSNTRYHYSKPENQFKTILIEPEPSRFEQLTQNVRWDENNILLNLEVGSVGENSLNEIFKKYIPTGEKIALMSIDIDGKDLDVFQALDTELYRPAIVIIEHGKWKMPTGLNQLVKAFSAKGYNLVHVTGNFIFVDEAYNVVAEENIHKLIRRSGNVEYCAYFKQITEEQKMQYDFNNVTFDVDLCGEQFINLEETE